MAVVTLGQGPVTLEMVEAVARKGAEVRLAPSIHQTMAKGRAVIDRFLAEDRPVYGLTRGLGQRAVVKVAEGELDEMSQIMLRARAAGAAPFFDRAAVRSFLFARLASFALGRAGLRPILADTYVAFLNKGLHPQVPEIGSGGASDLALLATLALPVIGEGKAEVAGEWMSGLKALEKIGLKPVALAPKEGLGLCSASSVSAGLGALVLQELKHLLELSLATTALTFEAFRANLSPIDARVVAARSAPGQAEAAASLHRHLSGSALYRKDAARRIQDPLSLRCASHLFGALKAAITFAEPNVLAELNGSGDNPVILFEDEEIISTGNFHTPSFAQAFDLLAISLCEVAQLTSQRIGKLLARKFTDLPDMLSSHADAGTVRIGLGILSMAARSLVKDMRMLATPASLDSQSGYDVEDHDPMTPRAVRKLRDALPLYRQIVACELIVAAAAFDLREPEGASPQCVRLRDKVRSLVAPLDDDRSLTEDLQRVTQAIEEGTITP